jgi:hypothetical protein
MTTMHIRQRMRDRHEARAWHDTIADHEDAKEAFRDEARRLLAAGAAVDGVDIDRVHARYLTPADLREHAKNPRTFAGCSGACNQGRKLCPVPGACGMPDAEPLTVRDFIADTPIGVRIGASIVAAAVAVVLALHFAARIGLLP